MSKERKIFMTDNATYKASNNFGFYRITKYYNNEVEIIYQMPVFDYLVKILQFMLVIFFAISITITLIQLISDEYKKTRK